MLLAATPFLTVFAALVMSTARIIGNGARSANMYSAIGLPWVHSLPADQHAAGVWALALGEAALFAAVLLLLRRWPSLDDITDPSDEGERSGAGALGQRGVRGGGDPTLAPQFASPLEPVQPEAVAHDEQ